MIEMPKFRRVAEEAAQKAREEAAKPNGQDRGGASPPISIAAVKSWPVLDPAALYGLPGDFVRAIEPHTEADPVALLLQYLAAAGNAIGRGPYYRVEGDRHGTNINLVLVGETAKGRSDLAYRSRP